MSYDIRDEASAYRQFANHFMKKLGLQVERNESAGKRDIKDLRDVLALYPKSSPPVATSASIPAELLTRYRWYSKVQGLVPTLAKLCECLALIDAGYLKSNDPLWKRHGH